MQVGTVQMQVRIIQTIDASKNSADASRNFTDASKNSTDASRNFTNASKNSTDYRCK